MFITNLYNLSYTIQYAENFALKQTKKLVIHMIEKKGKKYYAFYVSVIMR